MAKSNTVQIRLVSTADTGFFYVTKKNARAQTNKLELRKYDPVCTQARRVQGSKNQIARYTPGRRQAEEPGRATTARSHSVKAEEL